MALSALKRGEMFLVRATIRGLGVPHPMIFRFDPTWDGSMEIPPPQDATWEVLPHRLALALDTEHPVAFELLSPGDRKKAKHLYAAALRDILGLSEEEVCVACGYADASCAGRVISQARRLWQRIGGWPWCCVDVDQPLTEWRRHGGGARLDATFETWRTERLVTPAQAQLERTGIAEEIDAGDPDQIAAWYAKHVG